MLVMLRTPPIHRAWEGPPHTKVLGMERSCDFRWADRRRQRLGCPTNQWPSRVMLQRQPLSARWSCASATLFG